MSRRQMAEKPSAGLSELISIGEYPISRRQVDKKPSIDLSELIRAYKLNKTEADSYKKLVDDYNKRIKAEMSKRGLSEFIVDDIKATMTETVNKDFNELQAIEILRTNLSSDKFNSCVKTREYLDDAALENLIFDGSVDAALLAPCTTEKNPTITLRLGKVKSEDK